MSGDKHLTGTHSVRTYMPAIVPRPQPAPPAVRGAKEAPARIAYCRGFALLRASRHVQTRV